MTAIDLDRPLAPPSATSSPGRPGPQPASLTSPVGDGLFGSAVADFAAGRAAPLYLRRASGQVLRHDLAAYFAPPAGLPPPERALLRLAHGPVLDVGCGPARHARLLQAWGVPVAGLDNSARVLAVARALGLRHGIHADALHDPLPAGVGTVLLLDGNLGLAGTAAGARRLLERLAAVTVPNGRLLVSGRTPRRRPLRRWVLRHEYRGEAGPWFPWLQASLPAVVRLATSSGWRLHATFHQTTRYWAAFELR